VSGHALFVGAAVAFVAVMFAYVHRLAVGPTVFDRILGLNGFLTKSTLVLLLIGAAYDRVDMFVDISLAYGLLGFVGSLAAARYFEGARRDR
jgi:multicomponent Na+:H+ antiporter subunit F